VLYYNNGQRGQTGHWKNVLQRRRGGWRHIGVGGSPCGLSSNKNIIKDSYLFLFKYL